MTDIEAADLSGRHIEHFISITDENSPTITGLILWGITHDALDDPGTVRLDVGVWRSARTILKVPSEWPVTVGEHIHAETRSKREDQP